MRTKTGEEGDVDGGNEDEVEIEIAIERVMVSVLGSCEAGIVPGVAGEGCRIGVGAVVECRTFEVGIGWRISVVEVCMRTFLVSLV